MRLRRPVRSPVPAAAGVRDVCRRWELVSLRSGWAVHTGWTVWVRTVWHIGALTISWRGRHTVRAALHHHVHAHLWLLLRVRVLERHVRLADVAASALVELVRSLVLR